MTAALLYDLRERLQAADELLDELHNGDDRWPQSAALVATLDQIQERAEALKASGYGVR